MSKRYMYLLECIHDSYDWPKGSRIWTEHRCKGWRVIGKIEVK